MSERLKPCPFCNGHAKIDTKRESAGMDGSYANWIIHCEKCGAMITCPADRFYGRKALTEDEAIEAWNRRAIDALSQPEIVRCGECRHKGTKNCVANTWVTIFGFGVEDDFYCGLAERRTDENNNLHI